MSGSNTTNQGLHTIQQTYGKRLAEAALRLGAIRLSVDAPFQWASGYRMPIYNDNRRLLVDWSARALIAEAFDQILSITTPTLDMLAGTATAGIPHATTLADRLKKPLTYVRSASKGHGLGNQIEGLGAGGSYQGASVVVIEDLISTGGSSIKAIEAVRDADGKVDLCLSIFTYGFDAAVASFSQMAPPCRSISILQYDTMIEHAQEMGYITDQDVCSLQDWREDPFGWGIERGFPRVEG